MMSQKIVNKIAVITQDSYEQVLQEAVTALHNGELVVSPTETRYGLLVNASDSSALEKLYKAKNRPEFMPTAIFVKSQEEIFEYGESTPIAKKLVENFLPGPLTLVLKAKIPMEKYVVSNGKIGLRYSSSKLIADLLTHLDFPLSATSANISGANEGNSIDEIKNEFKDLVFLYIDGGNLSSPASTVVDASGDDICLHRIGAVSEGQIRKVLESI